jgi:hypothetical protein
MSIILSRPPSIADFAFDQPAEVFSGFRSGFAARPLVYRQFPTGAEAVRHVIEVLRPEMLPGTIIEADEARFDAPAIRELYARIDYPLPRAKRI